MTGHHQIFQPIVTNFTKSTHAFNSHLMKKAHYYIWVKGDRDHTVHATSGKRFIGMSNYFPDRRAGSTRLPVFLCSITLYNVL
jgi:hypothetical protein